MPTSEDKGYFIVPRALADLPWWNEKPFSKAHALVDLYRIANYKDGEIITKRGIIVKVKRGQVGWSFRLLAEKWGWAPNTAKLFLLKLKDCSQISMQCDTVTTLITLKDYDRWDKDCTQNSTQAACRLRAACTQPDPINTDKEVNTDKTGKEDAVQQHPLTQIFPPPLKALSEVPGYKVDMVIDGDYLQELIEEFPGVDVINLLKGWKAYKIDKPFKAKDNKRSQLRNQFVMAKERGLHKRGKGKGNGSGSGEMSDAEKVHAGTFDYEKAGKA
jgi:hypothetical protein